MADLRIVDAPVLLQESITDDVKMPTGGLGNFSIRLGDIVWYVVTKEQLASKGYVDLSSKGVKDSLDVHIADKANPHQVTKVQVGLGNVDNTADIDKPVSNATKSAIITATTDMATKTYVNQQGNLKADVAYVNSKDGDLTTLKTADKTNLVKAINEVVSIKADKATTLVGYGISDAYTKSEIDTNYGGVKTLYDKNVQAGAGANGWTALLVKDSSGQTQQQLNDKQRVFNDATAIVADIKSSNTWQQNRDIIQTANDKLHAKGGGTIQLPQGEYTVKGVILDENITVKGNNTQLNHPDGYDVDMFRTRTYSTTCTIAKDSFTLTVADATGFKAGSLIGIEAAAGINPYQNTTLVDAVDATQTTGFKLADFTGFNDFSQGHGNLMVDNEVISYTSIAGDGTLGGVKRGLFSSSKVSHNASAPVGHAHRHVSEIIAISGKTITILDKALSTVVDANIMCGTQKTNVIDVNINGKRNADDPAHRWSPCRFVLHRFGYADYYVENSENAGYLHASCDNEINIRAKDIGKPKSMIGAAVWIYQHSHRNQVNLKLVGDCSTGLIIDDRSVNVDEWSGGCVGNYGEITGNFTNFGEDNPTSLYNCVGGSNNRFTVSSNNVWIPVFIEDDKQGISADGKKRESRGNITDIVIDTCAVTASSDTAGNIYRISGKNILNPDAPIAEGNIVENASYIKYGSKSMTYSSPTIQQYDGSYAQPSYAFKNQQATGMSLSGNDLVFYKNSVSMLQISDDIFYFRDGKAISTGQGTGTKIGINNADKIGFFGVAPTRQPSGTPQPATDATTTTSLVNDIRAKLIALGLIG